MIEYPLRLCRQIRGNHDEIALAIDKELNRRRCPLYGVNMEFVRKPARPQRERRTLAVPARIPWTMHRPVYSPRLLADILHDVDLAALRPTRFVDIVPEHP